MAAVVARITSMATTAYSGPYCRADSGKQSMVTKGFIVLGCLGAMAGFLGTKVLVSEGIGMQTTAINLNPQQFLQANVVQMNFTAKMVKQSKLARLVRCLKHHYVQTKGASEAVSVSGIEVADIIEQPYPTSTLARFNHQL